MILPEAFALRLPNTVKSHYHSDFNWHAKPDQRFPWRRAQGRGGRGREQYWLLHRPRPQEKMVASAQAQGGGGARTGGAGEEGWGSAELMSIRRRDQKRGAGPRFPQAGGGWRAGARAQDSASYRMGARPSALGAEESASSHPPCWDRHSLGLLSSLACMRFCEHISLLIHASLRQMIGTYAADVACHINGKAPNTSQRNPEQHVQRVHRDQGM